MFDNRTAIDKAGLPGLQRRIDTLRGLGRNHFHLQVEGRLLGYCYIRKNACSSFKKMFLDLSPAEQERKAGERPIDFMRRHHRMQPEDFARCDRLIFVYRDPVQRIMSMFRNKFIAGVGATDIRRSFENLEGGSPDEASFRGFVESYLQKDFGRLDRHVLPQRMHLRRTVYTDVIPVAELHDRMAEMLGTHIADRYFRLPVNRTSDIPLRHVGGAQDFPIRDVRTVFSQNGYMPDDESFLTADLKAKLRARYAMDYAILDQTADATATTA